MPAEQYLKRKERLLISAIRLLDEGGLARVTTREMARREGISEPAVYRHFNGKAEILMAILEQFSAFDSNLKNTVIENEMDPMVAIRHICMANAGYYSGYPEIANVMFSLDLWKYDVKLAEKYEEILLSRYDLIRSLVAACIQNGAFRQDINIDALSVILTNLVISATRQWRFDGKSYSLVERVEDMLDLVLPSMALAAEETQTEGGNQQ